MKLTTYIFGDSTGEDSRGTIEDIHESGWPMYEDTGDDCDVIGMENPELAALLNRAAAAMETPGDLSADERKHLIDDLATAAREFEPRCAKAEEQDGERFDGLA